MKDISVLKIRDAVESLCIDACCHLPCDVKRVIEEINDPLVKICLDTGHHNSTKEDLYDTNPNFHIV